MTTNLCSEQKRAGQPEIGMLPTKELIHPSTTAYINRVPVIWHVATTTQVFQNGYTTKESWHTCIVQAGIYAGSKPSKHN